jgi:hypothetical protein
MQKKNLLVIFTMLAATVCIQAQITVTNATFPAVGDSLKIATDLNPVAIVVTAPGGPYTWDYSTLNSAVRQVTVFQPAVNGASFANYPTADLVVIGGAETYFDVSATAFTNLGISGSDIVSGLPIPAEVVFTPPLAERHAPLTFPNVFTGSTSVIVALPTSAIPGGILDSLGVPSGLLDSIRLRLTIARNDFVDGFGTLAIPGGTYNVLRQKRTDYTDTRIDIHVPFFGWQDVTDLLGVGGFGQDTTITYSFLSNTAKEPIAELTMDSTGLIVQQADFKDNGIASAVEPFIREKPEVVVSPNPATNQATFELKNIPSGQYALRLFDANGHSVLIKELSSGRESVSLVSLSGGMYMFHLTDAKNQIVASGKLLKVNP